MPSERPGSSKILTAKGFRCLNPLLQGCSCGPYTYRLSWQHWWLLIVGVLLRVCTKVILLQRSVLIRGETWLWRDGGPSGCIRSQFQGRAVISRSLKGCPAWAPSALAPSHALAAPGAWLCVAEPKNIDAKRALLFHGQLCLLLLISQHCLSSAAAWQEAGEEQGCCAGKLLWCCRLQPRCSSSESSSLGWALRVCLHIPSGNSFKLPLEGIRGVKCNYSFSWNEFNTPMVHLDGVVPT